MVRAFDDDEHSLRKLVNLDGVWSYRIDCDDSGRDCGWQYGIPKGRTIVIPSRSRGSEFERHIDVAWYEKELDSVCGACRFVIEAVLNDAEVYLDGELIFTYHSCFDSFDFIVNDVGYGTHRLIIRADNRFGSCAPHNAINDNTASIRGVSVEQLNGLCVLSSKLSYTLNGGSSDAICHLDISVYNASRFERASSLTVNFDGVKASESTVSVDGWQVKTVRSSEFMIEQLTLWDITDPKLYSVIISTDTDDLCERIGFRRLEIRDGVLILNGRPVDLQEIDMGAVCSELGNELTKLKLSSTIRNIKEHGFGLINGSNYTHSTLLLDILDEQGVLYRPDISISCNDRIAKADHPCLLCN